MGDSDAAKALALAEEEAASRRDAETLDTLAWAQERAGRLEDARATLRDALRFGLRDAPMLARAAAIERALGDPDRARSLYRQALETDPTHEAARAALCELGEG